MSTGRRSSIPTPIGDLCQVFKLFDISARDGDVLEVRPVLSSAKQGRTSHGFLSKERKGLRKQKAPLLFHLKVEKVLVNRRAKNMEALQAFMEDFL